MKLDETVKLNLQLKLRTIFHQIDVDIPFFKPLNGADHEVEGCGQS